MIAPVRLEAASVVSVDSSSAAVVTAPVAVTELENVAAPATVIVPPTLIFFCTPRPPAVLIEPRRLVVESVVSVVFTMPAAVTVPVAVMADANVEEETAVKEYEKVSHENAVQKTMKEQDVKYQLKEKASLEKNVADFKEDRSGEQAELDAVLEYYAKVKPGCTVKPMTYEERKKRREAEIAGLKEALTILEGETPAAFLAIRTVRRHLA